MPARAGDSSTTGSARNASASPGSRPRRVSKRCTHAAIRASTTPTSSSVGGARGRKPSVSPSPSAKKTPSKSSVWKWMFRFKRPPKRWMTVLDPDRPSQIPCRRARWRWKPSMTRTGHAEHRTRQRVIPRQEIAKTERQAQHLLAHGHPRQHLVDEAGSALGHAPAAAAREPRPLLENGTSRSNAQSLHRRRAKPYASTPQVRKSCFHRSGR